MPRIEDVEDVMPEARRKEYALACESLVWAAADAKQSIGEGSDQLAMAALDNILKGALLLRNAVGQWHNRVVCPFCRQEGRNIATPRQGESPGTPDWPTPHHVIDVGFTCEHCGKQWGFEVLGDAR